MKWCKIPHAVDFCHTLLRCFGTVKNPMTQVRWARITAGWAGNAHTTSAMN